MGHSDENVAKKHTCLFFSFFFFTEKVIKAKRDCANTCLFVCVFMYVGFFLQYPNKVN